jgi:hypothetical protein
MVKEFDYSYDKGSDVLYTFLDKPEKASCHDMLGLLARTSWETGQPCGVTVTHFTEWVDTEGKFTALALSISLFLYADIPEAEFELFYRKVLAKLDEAYGSLFPKTIIAKDA